MINNRFPNSDTWEVTYDDFLTAHTKNIGIFTKKIKVTREIVLSLDLDLDLEASAETMFKNIAQIAIEFICAWKPWLKFTDVDMFATIRESSRQDLKVAVLLAVEHIYRNQKFYDTTTPSSFTSSNFSYSNTIVELEDLADVIGSKATKVLNNSVLKETRVIFIPDEQGLAIKEYTNGNLRIIDIVEAVENE